LGTSAQGGWEEKWEPEPCKTVKKKRGKKTANE